MVKTRRSTCSQALVVILSALFLVFGCSTYKGQKYASIVDPKTKYVEPAGIPYTLTRPEFTLTQTPPAEGQKLPTYKLGVTYEPDPSHKYTLKIDPGIFADPNFTVKLAAGGTLQGTTATFTEQITPTISTLGQFTASLIGVLAAVAVLDKTTLSKAITDPFEKIDECKNPSSDVPVLCISEVTGPTCLPPTKVGPAMKERIDAFNGDQKFVELFHYVTEKERACLKAEKDYMLEQQDKERGDQLTTWQAKRKKYIEQHPDPANKDFADRLNHAVDTMESEEFIKLENEIKSDKDKKRISDDIEKARRDLLATAKIAGIKRAPTEAQIRLDFFLEMDIPTWSGRHLLYLEREIEKTEIFALLHPQLTDSQKVQINNFSGMLRRQRAATIGALELYDRSVVLSNFLNDIREKSVYGGCAPATSEYATARAELDIVLSQIESRRARVFANAKPAPAPQAPLLNVTNLKRVLPQAIEASKAKGWIDTDEGKKADDYVLVLKEVE